MFGSTFTGEDDAPEDYFTWEQRTMTNESQDNNEAASAPADAYDPSQNAAIIAKQVAEWTKERDRLQGMINAASASQSSTPVPRVGGPDEAKPDCGACPGDGSTCPSACRLANESPDSAHIAPQAAADTGAVDAVTYAETLRKALHGVCLLFSEGLDPRLDDALRSARAALAAVPPAKAGRPHRHLGTLLKNIGDMEYIVAYFNAVWDLVDQLDPPDSASDSTILPAKAEGLNAIIPDWKPCNPACDYEDPNGCMHDFRNENCSCDQAKASIARQRAILAQQAKGEKK